MLKGGVDREEKLPCPLLHTRTQRNLEKGREEGKGDV
jgi:hypothetical protein